VVTVLVRPGRGSTQMEKSSRLNWATQFLTVAYDCEYSPYVFFSEWREILSVPCLSGKKKLEDSSCLDVVEITRLLECFL
jgi:hypothetical protein